jgi:hypothetical protein
VPGRRSVPLRIAQEDLGPFGLVERAGGGRDRVHTDLDLDLGRLKHVAVPGGRRPPPRCTT